MENSTNEPLQPLLEARDIVKVYPDGTEALTDVTFKVYPGEVHGLLGENGAGKSTLTKIISGLLPHTSGQLLWKGRPADFKTPLHALQQGIGMVHQHFALVNPFTALENIALGQEGGKGLGSVEYERIEKRLKQVMEEGGLHAPLDIPIELLSVGVQQRIEILKLLLRDVDLLILDEPTAVLTPQEADEMFVTLRKLKEAGKTIIFITHKLREVLELTDQVTVLRRGNMAGSVRTADVDSKELANLMVGREVLPSIKRGEAKVGKAVLQVESLSARSELDDIAVKDLSFEVHQGEIFGIAGVEGNGQTELGEAIAGLRRWESGQVLLNGELLPQMNPRVIYERGLAHIPEDRRRVGMVLDFTVMENSILGLQSSKKFRGFLGKISNRKVKQHAQELIERFEVKTQSINTPAKSLSGGNQQKLVVGRELSKDPDFILAAQPTRGLDIGATQYIRDLLVELRDQGKAILLISAELDEIFQLADRVGVMYEGEFTGIYPTEELDRERIGLLMGGLQEAVQKA